MELETTIAEAIDTADDKAKYDAACKKLLAEKIILAWIMKNTMKEYSSFCVEKIARNYIEGTPQIAEIPIAPDQTNKTRISGTGVEDTTITEGTITYDIRFFAILPNSKDHVRMIINVEAQNDFYPGYPLIKRAIYYCSRMISAQYGTEFTKSHYEKINKVYSIWICSNPPKERQNSITRYSITEENLFGNVKEAYENYDLVTAIMICLGKPDSKDTNQLLQLLDVLLSSDSSKEEKKKLLQDNFNIPMTEQIERTVSEMCNLSKGIEEKGIEQGIEQGVLSSIKNLMESTGWTAERAMEALKIPAKEQSKYLSFLMQAKVTE